MELLFVYEDKVACDDQGIFYTGSTFSQPVFDRYLQFYSHIVLLARHADENADITRMNPLNPQKVSVVFLPNLRSNIFSMLNPKLHFEFRRTIENELSKGRAVFLRVPSRSGTIAAKYCQKHGQPFLEEVVGCTWDSLWNHSLAGKMLAPIEFLRQRRTVRIAPYAIYVTNQFLQKRYPTNGVSVGISDVELQPMDDAVLAKRLQKIEKHNGKIKIGTAAAVDVSYKGQQYVIEAISQLKKQGETEFEYHLAGGGDQTCLCTLAEKLGVSNQVIFEGGLPHERMFDWLDEIDLYIQPSLQEGLPRAVVEAMSRGLPVIGAKTGGIPELIGDEAIVPQKNSAAIAEVVSKLSKEQMTSMAKHNFARAKDFDKETLKAKRSEFYKAFAAACKENQNG